MKKRALFADGTIINVTANLKAGKVYATQFDAGLNFHSFTCDTTRYCECPGGISIP